MGDINMKKNNLCNDNIKNTTNKEGILYIIPTPVR